MQINTRVSHDLVVIELKGRITVETEAQFCEVVRPLLKAEPPRLVLDLMDVPYIDSVGIGVIVLAYTSARRRGGDLKFLHVRGRNRRLLAITKLLTVFEAFDTEDEVERSFEPDYQVEHSL